jgi:hypothetical protein
LLVQRRLWLVKDALSHLINELPLQRRGVGPPIMAGMITQVDGFISRVLI